MQPQLVSYKNSVISYYLFGSGPRLSLCFHGYGEDATGFQFLEKYAGKEYTFIAIDLPFHGKTDWKDGLTFTNRDLHQVLSNILNGTNHKFQTSNIKFSLIGFSLGGRAVLSLFQLQPEKIEKIILLAPDGLKVNFWYWLATRTRLGNKLFASTMKYPGWFFFLLKIFDKFRLVNTSVLKFVNHYIGNEKARRILYQRWTCLRKLKPDLHLIKSFISKYKIPVRLVYGKHDRIILPARGEKFKKGHIYH